MTRFPQVDTAAYDEALPLAQSDAPDWPRVYALLQDADAAGDRRATYAIATWYLYGKPPVVERSRKKAVKLLRVAGRVIAHAAYDLAVCYEEGAGTRRDPGRALRWYMQAELLGDAQSHYEVGRCFYWGIGTEAIHGLAEPWFDKAEALGYVEKPSGDDDPELTSKAKRKKKREKKKREKKAPELA